MPVDYRTNFTLKGISQSGSAVTIKRPNGFSISRFMLTKSGRLANGTMYMELVAKKQKFAFSYDAITSTEWDKILGVLWDTDDVFFTLTYKENNITKSAVVYAGELPEDLHHTGAVWVYQNIKFDLIEQ